MKKKVLFFIGLVSVCFCYCDGQSVNRLNQTLLAYQCSLSAVDRNYQRGNGSYVQHWRTVEYLKFRKLREGALFDLSMQRNLSEEEKKIQNNCAVIAGQIMIILVDLITQRMID